MKKLLFITLILILNINTTKTTTNKLNPPLPIVCKEVVPPESITHQDVILFIAKQEGFHTICKDDGSQFTNGYGTKAKFKGEIIDKKEGLKRLKEYYYRKLTYTKKTYPNLTLQEAMVITAVFYNIGSASKKPLLHQAISVKDFSQIKKHLLNYIGTNPKYKKGLTNRRVREVELLKKVWNFA